MRTAAALVATSLVGYSLGFLPLGRGTKAVPNAHHSLTRLDAKYFDASGDPIKPALSAYMHFCGDERSRVTERLRAEMGTDFKATAVMVKLGELWRGAHTPSRRRGHVSTIHRLTQGSTRAPSRDTNQRPTRTRSASMSRSLPRDIPRKRRKRARLPGLSRCARSGRLRLQPLLTTGVLVLLRRKTSGSHRVAAT